MVKLELKYNKLASARLSDFCESVELIERLTGKASTLSVTLCDTDRRFSVGNWRAVKGDGLSVQLDDVPAELYSIDSVSVSRAPAVVTWQCTARPRTTSSPANRGRGTTPPSVGADTDAKKTWQQALRNVSLKSVAERVCAECGMSLSYTASKNPTIPYVARYKETGWHLLERLCRQNGLGIRGTSEKIIIIPSVREASAPLAEPQETISVSSESIIQVGNIDSLAPQRVVSARFDPRSQRAVSFSAGDGIGAQVDFDFDLDEAGDIWESAARDAMLGTIQVVPDARFVAGAVLDIFGALRKVVEMKYTRSGDSEEMELKTVATK